MRTRSARRSWWRGGHGSAIRQGRCAVRMSMPSKAEGCPLAVLTIAAGCSDCRPRLAPDSPPHAEESADEERRAADAVSEYRAWCALVVKAGEARVLEAVRAELLRRRDEDGSANDPGGKEL